MSPLEWTILFAALSLGLAGTGVLLARRHQTPRHADRTPRSTPAPWLELLELRLMVLALSLHLLWEIAQFPLYTVWHQHEWSYIVYGLAHCTLGDLLIMPVLYGLVALLRQDRHWHAHRVFSSGLLFTLGGVAFTVLSEIYSVGIEDTWGYTELMPIVPILRVGGTPFLQWLLIPPILLWLMRLMSRQRATAAKV